MAKKLYVGNLSYGVTEDQLRDLFSEVGEVGEVALITDRDTGRSKGFGFVEMAKDEDAEAAITKYNGYSFEDRELTVNEARPREERPQRSGGYGGGGGGYGGGGGGYGGGGGGYGGGGGGNRRDDRGGGGGRRRY